MTRTCFPSSAALQPGETFTSAKSSIAFFADGKGFADPRWVMPSYTSQVLMKKGSSYQPPWIYNTWEPFERGITKAITMDLIAAAGRMGMDVFTIDDGWQADYGDNAINLKLFPNGLDEIQAAVEQRGMRLGLWAPLAAISMNIRGLSGTPRVDLQRPERKAQVHGDHGGFAGRDVPRHSLSGGGREADQRIDWPLSPGVTSRSTSPPCLTLTVNLRAAMPRAMTTVPGPNRSSASTKASSM